MSENKGLAKGLLFGFIAGGIAGAITALLLAPKSGKELRSDLKRKATDLAEDATEYVKTAREQSSDMMSKGRAKADNLGGFVTEVKEKAEHILGDAEKVLSGIQKRANAEQGKVKSAFRAGMDAYQAEKEKTHRG